MTDFTQLKRYSSWRGIKSFQDIKNLYYSKQARRHAYSFNFDEAVKYVSKTSPPEFQEQLTLAILLGVSVRTIMIQRGKPGDNALLFKIMRNKEDYDRDTELAGNSSPERITLHVDKDFAEIQGIEKIVSKVIPLDNPLLQHYQRLKEKSGQVK
ncbi:MAG: hypothetical protein ABIH72_05895 [archaeon]